MSDDETAPPGTMPRRMPKNWVAPPTTYDVLSRINQLMDEQKEERTAKKFNNFKQFMNGKGGELLRELSQYKAFVTWKLEKQQLVLGYHQKLFAEKRLPFHLLSSEQPFTEPRLKTKLSLLECENAEGQQRIKNSETTLENLTAEIERRVGEFLKADLLNPGIDIVKMHPELMSYTEDLNSNMELIKKDVAERTLICLEMDLEKLNTAHFKEVEARLEIKNTGVTYAREFKPSIYVRELLGLEKKKPKPLNRASSKITKNIISFINFTDFHSSAPGDNRTVCSFPTIQETSQPPEKTEASTEVDPETERKNRESQASTEVEASGFEEIADQAVPAQSSKIKILINKDFYKSGNVYIQNGFKTSAMNRYDTIVKSFQNPKTCMGSEGSIESHIEKRLSDLTYLQRSLILYCLNATRHSSLSNLDTGSVDKALLQMKKSNYVPLAPNNSSLIQALNQINLLKEQFLKQPAVYEAPTLPAGWITVNTDKCGSVIILQRKIYIDFLTKFINNNKDKFKYE